MKVNNFDPATGQFCGNDQQSVKQLYTRSHFDDICDYHFLEDNKVRDVNGNIIIGLEQFSISVAIAEHKPSSNVKAPPWQK